MFSPIRVRRCTVLADARPDGRLPPLDLAECAAAEARERAEAKRRTRVGAGTISSEPIVSTSTGGGESWKMWIPLALVPIGGLVGFGAATLLGLHAGTRMAASALGGLALGTVGAASISLMSALPHPGGKS